MASLVADIAERGKLGFGEEGWGRVSKFNSALTFFSLAKCIGKKRGILKLSALQNLLYGSLSNQA